MLNPSDITLGSTVTFELYPSMLVAAKYTRAKVLSLLDASDANRFIDIAAMHIQVYPTLPAGVPNDPHGYYYLKLLLISGETTVIGIPWIIDATWTVETGQSLRLTIPNITSTDETIIRTQLTALGYTLVDVQYLA